MVDCSLRVGSDLLLQVREISLVSLFECEGKIKCILDRHFSVESAEMQALYEAKKELCLQAQLSIQANLHSSPHQWLRDLGRNRKKKNQKSVWLGSFTKDKKLRHQKGVRRAS